MPQSCDYKIAQAIQVNCEAPSVKGLKNNGWIMNYADIDFDTCTKNKNIISTLALKSGAKAYPVYVPGKAPFTGTVKNLETGTYKNKFTKKVGIVILDNGPDVCENVIDQLANGTFVLVLENKYQGSDKKNTFEVYGYEQGMNATALDDDKYSDDTDGGWSCTLEESGAPSAGVYLFDTDIQTTRAALKSLESGSAA